MESEIWPKVKLLPQIKELQLRHWWVFISCAICIEWQCFSEEIQPAHEHSLLHVSIKWALAQSREGIT